MEKEKYTCTLVDDIAQGDLINIVREILRPPTLGETTRYNMKEKSTDFNPTTNRKQAAAHL